MTDLATSRDALPTLRLVVRNPGAFRPLMPIRALDRLMASIERRLGRRDLDAIARDSLVRQRTLITAILAARPFEPGRARRLEQELRWLRRADTMAADADRSWWRIIDPIRAILWPGRTSPRAARPVTSRTRAATPC